MLESVLERVRRGVGGGGAASTADDGAVVEVRGRVRGFLGTKTGEWRHVIGVGGSRSFVESVEARASKREGGHALRFATGCADKGGNELICWETDISGNTALLAYDDRETMLLTAWVRHGLWLMWSEDDEQLEVALARVDGGGGVPSLRIGMKDGTLTGLVTLGPLAGSRDDALVPKAVSVETPRGVDRWEFSDEWIRSHGAAAIPSVQTHYPPVDGSVPEVYALDECETGVASHPQFAMPPAFTSTHDDSVKYDDDPGRARCVATRSTGGHILVRADLDGRDLGWWIVDSAGGATFAITRKAAEAMSMDSFGEVRMNGIGDSGISSKLRRLRSSSPPGALSVGQCSVSNPTFVELELDGAVQVVPARGHRFDSDEVVGVIGSSFLSRAVLEVRRGKREYAGSPKPPEFSVSFFSPAGWEAKAARAPARVSAGFQEVVLIGGSPHVSAAMHTGESAGRMTSALPIAPASEDAEDAEGASRTRSGAEGRSLLQIGLGIGGAGLILRRSVAMALGLGDGIEMLSSNPSAMMTGMGESTARMLYCEDGILSARLPHLEFVGNSFENVRTLVHVPTSAADRPEDIPTDFELSPYCAGVVTASLFAVGCCFVLDCTGGVDGRQRVSITKL